MKKITVSVARDGETKVEASGFSGGTCVQSTAPLTKALIGENPDSSIKKPEFHLPSHINRDMVQVAD